MEILNLNSYISKLVELRNKITKVIHNNYAKGIGNLSTAGRKSRMYYKKYYNYSEKII